MSSTKNLLVVVVLLLFTFSLYSQKQNNLTTWQMLKYDGASVFGGVKHAYTQPFKWKQKDWATFGGIVAGATILLALDEPANDYFTNQRDGVPRAIRETGFRFGKPIVNYGLTTGVYAFGLLTKNEKVRKTGVLLIASATAGGIIQTVSKTLAGRARPITGKDNLSFKFYSSEADYHSFPSGHAILSFTTAYAIAKQFDNPYVKGGIYAVGLLSPVSRLWEGAHWLTDVVLGVALSVVIVDGIDNYLNNNERYVYDTKKFKIKWDLRLGAGQIGVVGRF
ncbi:phosphatase PAP2 family protein [Aquimarina sp. 2201CG5-10]|uniref:phosphatase PAP2 family protein n=1 Tax=Aquimarina callyspongiae TaxID=3098150 RepID=UPI002AB52073|nr:phosphatase PAP2 family protein [Aquimarina sp. 2201CG5-10]MDY8134740.1 phosphatase PAP2 family protein [Aquimarina sp. 2201CG5-10]